MGSDLRSHWETVYRTKDPTRVSWYRAHLDLSLALITAAVPDRAARIIDVGGGGSTLVDDLLTEGYRNIDVLDLSQAALDGSRQRLGDRAAGVGWLRGDVTTYPFGRDRYDLWHDRAVFHFLTDEGPRRAYVHQVASAVKPGGHVLVAAFGPDGPTQCSGLPVARYDAAALHDEFGPAFTMLEHRVELHRTPAGSEQQFVYCLCRTSDR